MTPAMLAVAVASVRRSLGATARRSDLTPRRAPPNMLAMSTTALHLPSSYYGYWYYATRSAGRGGGRVRG
jgi:hypothetical protein